MKIPCFFFTGFFFFPQFLGHPGGRATAGGGGSTNYPYVVINNGPPNLGISREWEWNRDTGGRPSYCCGLSIQATNARACTLQPNKTPQNLQLLLDLETSSSKSISLTSPLPSLVVLRYLERCSRGQYLMLQLHYVLSKSQLRSIELSGNPG